MRDAEPHVGAAARHVEIAVVQHRESRGTVGARIRAEPEVDDAAGILEVELAPPLVERGTAVAVLAAGADVLREPVW